MNLEHLFTGRTPQASHYGIFGGESGNGGRFFSEYPHYSLSVSFHQSSICVSPVLYKNLAIDNIVK